MNEQLTYILITPTALHKGRLGGILSRLLSRSGLRLVGGELFAPTPTWCEALADCLTEQKETATYLRQLGGGRSLILLLKGENAIELTHRIVGSDQTMQGQGETIRDTFGDYVLAEEGLRYFEPAAIAPANSAEAEKGLSIFAQEATAQPNVLDATNEFPNEKSLEKTLVLIKPDNFRFPSMRPGGVLDILTQTGLALISFKIHHMSVAEAKEFYGPVLPILEAKIPNGHLHWEEIIAFMSGGKPSTTSHEESQSPGSQTCIALIYQGPDAITKVRQVLGATNPANATQGTVRKEFGQDIMVNAAHASDAPESVLRETAIIRIGENNFEGVIASYLA